MGRIRTYEFDTDLNINDYLLGNDADDTSAIATKRFSLLDLRTFILEGQNIDILGQTPRGHGVAVNQDGVGIDRSTLQISHVTQTLPLPLVDIAQTGLAVATYTMGSNGNQAIRFENFALPYYLPSLDGAEVQFSLQGDTTVYTVTVTGYSGLTYDTANPNERATNNITPETYYDTIAVTGGPTMDGVSIDTLSITQPGTNDVIRLETTLSSLRVTGTFQVDGTATFNSTSQFNDHVTLGTANPNTDPVDLTVHGTIHLEDQEGGITFGAPDPSVTFTTDGDNLTVGGGGAFTVQNNSTFQNPIVVDSNADATDGRTVINETNISITGTDGSTAVVSSDGIDRTDAMGNALPGIEVVVGNGVGGTNQGQLSSIQVGDEYCP